jgi:hypothetical protein
MQTAGADLALWCGVVRLRECVATYHTGCCGVIVICDWLNRAQPQTTSFGSFAEAVDVIVMLIAVAAQRYCNQDWFSVLVSWLRTLRCHDVHADTQHLTEEQA